MSGGPQGPGDGGDETRARDGHLRDGHLRDGHLRGEVRADDGHLRDGHLRDGHLRGAADVDDASPTVPELLATDALLDRLARHEATERDLRDTVARLLDGYAAHADPATAGAAPLAPVDPVVEVPATEHAEVVPPRVLLARRRTLQRIGRGAVATCAVLTLMGGTAAAAVTSAGTTTGVRGASAVAGVPDWVPPAVVDAIAGTPGERAEREILQARTDYRAGREDVAQARLDRLVGELEASGAAPQLLDLARDARAEASGAAVEQVLPPAAGVLQPGQSATTAAPAPLTLPWLVARERQTSTTPGTATTAPTGSPTAPAGTPSSVPTSTPTATPTSTATPTGTPAPADPPRGGGAPATPVVPAPGPTSPAPTPADPVPTPTSPVPTPTDPVPVPTDPVPVPTDPVPGPTDPVPTPADPVPTATPTPTPTPTPSPTPAEPTTAPTPTDEPTDGAGTDPAPTPTTGPTEPSPSTGTSPTPDPDATGT